jgi:hypothetical protein
VQLIEKTQTFVFIFLLSERRPLKATVAIPVFRSSSSRLNPQDIMEDDRGRSVDGLNLTSSLEGSHNEALHYSFMPNKQIVSLSFFFPSFFSISHPFEWPMNCLLVTDYNSASASSSSVVVSLHSLSSELFILMNSLSRFVKIAINHNIIMRNLCCFRIALEALKG